MNKLIATALAVAFAKAQTIQGSVICVYSAADFIPEEVTWTLIKDFSSWASNPFEPTIYGGNCKNMWGSKGQMFDNTFWTSSCGYFLATEVAYTGEYANGDQEIKMYVSNDCSVSVIQGW